MALEQMSSRSRPATTSAPRASTRSTSSTPRALHAADNIMTFKLAVKTLAQRNGLHATFMPKPIFGVAGSGMHTNMSLFRDGRNVFYDPNDPKGLSREAYSFIAGLPPPHAGHGRHHQPPGQLLQAAGAGYEAPCYLAWSASNRSALIRIPAAAGRAPGWSCAPPTRPATPIWPSPSAWPPAWTALRRA